MSNKAKREYVEAVRSRYQAASREEKSLILDEMCRVCGFHRKYAIRILSIPLPSKGTTAGRRAGRPPKYTDPRIRKFALALWRASNLACGKRLHAMIPYWLPAYVASHPSPLPDRIQHLILTLSASTLDRMLASAHRKEGKIGMSTTRPGSLLRQQVPIRTNQWEETRPGFVEVDSVAHCGTSTAGTYVNTIDMLDIATGWNEQRAVWGKGETGVFVQLGEMEEALPFALRGIDMDNGGEFLNHHLFKFYTHRRRPVEYTRSRPYHKNDNAHIEQKNWTAVRQYLGYDRFDDPAIVGMLNELYTTEWRMLQNMFIASVKLISKERIGSRIVKRYDKPKTPVQRCLESPDISKAQKKRLRELLVNLDPFELQRRVSRKIQAIFHYLERTRSV
jgi:hypothetical protein